MTDYNDGNWHVWGSGECPVHPESVVTVKWSFNGIEATERAKCFDSWKGSEICAFRVVRAHRELRECWGFCNITYNTEEEARATLARLHRENPALGFDEMQITHWREVIE